MKDAYAKILSQKELSPIFDYIEEKFGVDKNTFKSYAFLQKEDKIWICSRDLLENSFGKIRLRSLGLLFCRFNENKVKITTNAAQIFCKGATKSVIEINKEQLKNYLQGYDIVLENVGKGFVLLKHENEIIGVGLATEGRIKNVLPKAKRMESGFKI